MFDKGPVSKLGLGTFKFGGNFQITAPFKKCSYLI